MDWTDVIPIILTAGIFLIAFLSLLLVSFQAMLGPIKNNQSRLEAEMKSLKTEIKEIKEIVIAK